MIVADDILFRHLTYDSHSVMISMTKMDHVFNRFLSSITADNISVSIAI